MTVATVDTARVKYVFLDIVGYTRDRSVEAQSELVAILNSVVRSTLTEMSIPPETTILIPTGDGMAIALIEAAAYDLHLLLATNILGLVAKHNGDTQDRMRQFQLRIGLNENVDNLVLDINGRRNVAGHGIAMAQRIMDKADGGQILLGLAVFEALRPREKYMNAFKSFEAASKHGLIFPVYQYAPPTATRGLNIDTPSSFAIGGASRHAETKFSKVIAYYMTHAYCNRRFLCTSDNIGADQNAVITLLWFLAMDSLDQAEPSQYARIRSNTWNAGVATFQEQFEHYHRQDGSLIDNYADYIWKVKLFPFAEYFEYANGLTLCIPTELAIRKLCLEYPSIASSFEIGTCSAAA